MCFLLIIDYSPAGQMDINTALPTVIRKSLIHDGLLKGLNEYYILKFINIDVLKPLIVKLLDFAS